MKTVEKLYSDGQYQEAVKLLEEGRGQLAPSLWHYNLGTLYGKLEQWPEARFHFLMAELNGFSSIELNQSLSLVEEKLEIGRYEKNLEFQDYLIKGMINYSDGLYTFFSLLFLLITLFLYLKKKSQKLIIITFCCSAIFLVLNLWILTWDRFIVFEKNSIYDGPSSLFKTTSELPEGVMIVTINKDGWHKIIYPSRFAGWIKDKGLKEFK